MRIEWGRAISNRRWDVMDWLARKEPSQQLCDTIFELSLGLDEKEEKRVLRGILHRLKLAGFEPREIGPEETLPAGVPPIPSRGWLRAWSGNSDVHGGTYFVLGIPAAPKWHLTMCVISKTWGSYFIKSASGPLNRIEPSKPFLTRWKSDIIVEIHPEYAAAEITRAMDTMYLCEHLSSTVSKSDVERIRRHAECPDYRSMVKPAGITDEERSTLFLNHPGSSSWRAMIGTLHDMWADIHAIRWDPEIAESQRVPLFREVIERHKLSIVTPEMVSHHAWRMRHLAYLLALQGDELAGKYAMLAKDLDRNLSDAPYFRTLLDKTAEDLQDLMEQDEEEPLALGWAA